MCPRGLCPAHTRGLLAESGAAAPLVFAYRHVIEAAVGDITARKAACLACEHAASAADWLFGYLLGEATRGDRRTYKQHGGLCVPHLRRAAVARRGADVLWLVRFMIVRLTAPSPSLDVLAGDAGAATALAPPGRLGENPVMCTVCAAEAEAARPERAKAAGDFLCPQHLHGAVMAAGAEAADLLAEQAALHTARLGQVVDGRARNLGNYLSQLAAVSTMDVGQRTGSVASARTALRRAAEYLDGSALGAGSTVIPSGYGPEREVQLRYTQRRRGSP